MLPDALPRKANRAQFLESDQMKTLDLPNNGRLPSITKSIESAMKGGKGADVRNTCADFLATASDFYEVPTCGIRVLAARPFDPETSVIRVWMRTAVRKEVTSFGTFLSILCHEFCHHLDFKKSGLVDSWHTRGFYERAAVLYHYARSTPLKKLFWVPMAGGRWRIDWQRTNRGA
jgi:hypothetical protein